MELGIRRHDGGCDLRDLLIFNYYILVLHRNSLFSMQPDNSLYLSLFFVLF